MFTAEDVRQAQARDTDVCRIIKAYVKAHLVPHRTKMVVRVDDVQPPLSEEAWHRAAVWFSDADAGFKHAAYDAAGKQFYLDWTPVPAADAPAQQAVLPPPRVPVQIKWHVGGPVARFVPVAPLLPVGETRADAVKCDFGGCEAAAQHHNIKGKIRNFCDAHRCRQCTGMHMISKDNPTRCRSKRKRSKLAVALRAEEELDEEEVLEATPVSDEEFDERPPKRSRHD